MLLVFFKLIAISDSKMISLQTAILRTMDLLETALWIMNPHIVLDYDPKLMLFDTYWVSKALLCDLCELTLLGIALSRFSNSRHQLTGSNQELRKSANWINLNRHWCYNKRLIFVRYSTYTVPGTHQDVWAEYGLWHKWETKCFVKVDWKWRVNPSFMTRTGMPTLAC